MSINMKNININEFDNICRACMSDCPIKFFRDSTVTNIYYKLTDIHFETNDELPQQICIKCFHKIKEIHEFEFLCKQTHFNLMECLNNSKNIGSNENQEIIDKINEPVEIKEEITIEEHKIEFIDVDLYSTYDGITKLENKPVINKDINNELKEVMISEKSEFNNIQKNNPSEVDLVIPNTSNIIVKNEDKSEIKANLKDKKKNKRSTKKMNYKCNQCLMLFNHLGNLKSHMRTHTGERPYKCDKCTKTFIQSNGLNYHMRQHTGERPYKCNKCTKTFIQLNTLNIHLRTHTGERPFKCEQCTKAFTQLCILEKHKLTHTGERPYKCNLCTKTCTQLGNLKSHMRTHTGERPNN